MGATTPCTKLEQLLRKVRPCQFAFYQEFMRALMIETLANHNMTFDQLNYDLFALANARPDIISDSPSS